MIQAKLKLEIIAGYLIWVFFFVLIVCIIHDSRQKRSAMERQEAHWQGERQQTNRAFFSRMDGRRLCRLPEETQDNSHPAPKPESRTGGQDATGVHRFRM